MRLEFTPNGNTLLLNLPHAGNVNIKQIYLSLLVVFNSMGAGSGVVDQKIRRPGVVNQEIEGSGI